jgi:hypothetical protein
MRQVTECGESRFSPSAGEPACDQTGLNASFPGRERISARPHQSEAGEALFMQGNRLKLFVDQYPVPEVHNIIIAVILSERGPKRFSVWGW